MSRKLKNFAVLGTVAGAASAGAVALIVRLRDQASSAGEVASSAGKAAATAGVITTTAGPALLSDKASLPDIAQVLDVKQAETTRQATGRFLTPFMRRKPDEAIKMFETFQIDGQPAADQQKTKMLITAAHYKKTPESMRHKTMNWLADQYPAGEAQGALNEIPQDEIALGLWSADMPDRAVSYTQALLPHIKQQITGGDNEATAAAEWIGRLADYAANKDMLDTDSGRALAAQLESTLPASEAAQSAGGRSVAAAIVRLQLADDRPEDAVAYTRDVIAALPQMRQDNESTPGTSFVGEVFAALGSIDDAKRRQSLALRVLKPATERLGAEPMQSHWVQLARAAGPAQQQQVYGEILAAFRQEARPLTQQLQPQIGKEQSLQAIVSQQLPMVALEIQHDGPPVALETLTETLNQRNASSRLATVTRFLWEQFPAAPAAGSAFGAWARHQMNQGNTAAAGEAAKQALASYSDQPVAEVARLVQARRLIERGEPLAGVLKVARHRMDREISSDTSLSVNLIENMAQSYVDASTEAGFQADWNETVFKLARQLENAGESLVASTLYYRLATRSSDELTNPVTGSSFQPPKFRELNTTARQAQAMLWRAIAQHQRGEVSAAADLLKKLTKNHPDTPITTTARLMAVRYLQQQEQWQAAWTQLQNLPKPVQQKARIARVMSTISAQANAQQAQLERREQIVKLQSQLAGGNVDNKARLLMKLADLLRQNERYQQAATRYQQLADDHTDSDLRPEALYRAIRIHRQQLNNPEQAQTLLQTLRQGYPSSKYLGLLTS